MRTDHSLLISGGRRPLRAGLADRETGKCDIADLFLLRIKTVSPQSDLNVLQIRILLVEIGKEDGLVRLRILPASPGIDREIRIPGGQRDFRMTDLLRILHFVHGFII